MRSALIVLVCAIAACRQTPSQAVIEASAIEVAATAPLPDVATPVDVAADVSVATALGGSTLAIANASSKPTQVFVAFGADSVVLPSSWAICASASQPLNCSFALAADTTQTLALAGKYLNATISFDAPVGCGSTKAELNVNNPKWFDVADISLVDGFNRDLRVLLGAQQLGPTHGKDDNATAIGVFPLGCDICVARQSPPCGIAPSPTPGSAGCKHGTQYAPDVPCQLQGAVKGGGSAVVVTLLP